MLDFFEEHENDPAYSRTVAIHRGSIAQALTRCDSTGLKMAYRDLREEIEDLPPGDQAELKQRLETLFSADVEAEVQQEMLRTREIVRKGQIANDDEYAVLRAYLEHHVERWGTSAFVARATDLVAEYEQRMQ